MTRLISHVANLEREQNKFENARISFDKRAVELGVDLSDVMDLFAGGLATLPVQPKPTVLWRFVEDPGLRSHLVFMWFFTTNKLSSLDDVESELETIRSIIDQTLGPTAGPGQP